VHCTDENHTVCLGLQCFAAVFQFVECHFMSEAQKEGSEGSVLSETVDSS